MTSALSITRSANVPRAAFLDYPLGRTSGPPNQPEVQLDIIRRSLALFNTFQTPGQVETLPHVWSATEGDAWKEKLSLPKKDSGEAPADDERTDAIERGDSAVPNSSTAPLPNSSTDPEHRGIYTLLSAV